LPSVVLLGDYHPCESHHRVTVGGRCPRLGAERISLFRRPCGLFDQLFPVGRTRGAARQDVGLGELELGVPGDDGHTELPRQGSGVVVLRNPTGGQQHVMGGHPAVEGLGLGPQQRARIDQRADQERLFMQGGRTLRPGWKSRRAWLGAARHPRAASSRYCRGPGA